VGTVEADGDSATVEDPKDRDVEIVLICAPEGKIVKNRVHIDLGADDMDAEVDRLMDLGAERVERIKTWTMMRDPEDNEFCVVQADEKDPVSGWRP